MKRSWDAFVDRIDVVGRPHPYTQASCDQAARRLGLTCLPQSYSEYIHIFGFGKWEPALEIMVPADSALVGSIEDLVRDERELFEFWISRPGHAIKQARLRGMISFANTTIGLSFAWDSSIIRAQGEMQICLLELPDILPLDCWHLLEFLDVYWLGNKLNEYYPFEGGWPTKPIFTVRQLKKPYGKST